jgi:hypothetical protein
MAGAKGLYPDQFFNAFNGPASMVTADLDGDGHPDIAEIGFDGTVAALLNNDHGGFHLPKAFYVAGTQPESIQVGDLNGDGKPDIVVADGTGNAIVVLIGRGNGSFVAQTASEQAQGKGTAAPSYATGTAPTGLALADVNGDGKLDAVTTNFTDGTLSVLLGKGDGTFGTATTITVGASPTAVAAADFDGDGKPDLLVANSADGTLSYLKGRGDGSFAAQVTMRINPAPARPTVQALVVADFNHDGKLDVVATTTDPNADTVAYLPGNGDGTFRLGHTLTTGLATRFIQAADVDGDGNLDLVAGSSTNGTLRVLRGTGTGKFDTGVDYPAPGINGAFTSQAFDLADVDGDGKPDILAINSAASIIQVLYNDGSGGFHLKGSYATGHVPSGVASGDLDGDGHQDVVEVDAADGTLGVRLGAGDGTLGPLTTYTVGSHPQRVLLADLDGDGKLDAATVNNGDGTVSVLMGNGDGTFRTARNFSAGPNPVDLAVADMDQDGKLDLIVANQVVNRVSILRGDGAGGFLRRKIYLAGSQINALAVGDTNRDGFPDVVTVGGNVAVLYNDGHGGLEPIVLNDDGTSDEVYSPIGVRIALLDVNHNGLRDIVVADYSDSQIAVLRDFGKGHFRDAVDFATCANPIDMQFADLNADGDVDIAVSCVGSSSVSVMLGNGDGAFISTAYPVEIDPRGIAIADLDEDGQPDLVTVNGGSDNLNILLQINGVVAADTAPTVAGAPFFVPDGKDPVSGILNGKDKDGDGLIFGVVIPPTIGIVFASSDGSFTYLANTGESGKDSFQFQATDGVKLSNIGTIPITVKKNTAGVKSGGGGFLGGFWLPLLPLLLAIRARRRARMV